MPKQFGQTLPEQDLDKIVDYLASLGVKTIRVEEQPKIVLSRSRPAESEVSSFAPEPAPEPSAAQVALGKVLFFDPRLSASNALSCASCHLPDKAFTDGRALSLGYPGTALFRNTPTVWNVLYQKSCIGMPTLGSGPADDGARSPHRVVPDGLRRTVADRTDEAGAAVRRTVRHGVRWRALLRQDPQRPGCVPADTKHRSDALRQVRGRREASTLRRCSSGAATLSRQSEMCDLSSAAVLQRSQVPRLGARLRSEDVDEPERHITFRRFLRTLGTPNYRNLRSDLGRYHVTLNDADRGKFRTPSLRELVHTGPYMHDGRFEKLEDVVDFYSNGGGKDQRALKALRPDETREATTRRVSASLSSELPEVKVPEMPNYDPRATRQTDRDRNTQIDAEREAARTASGHRAASAASAEGQPNHERESRTRSVAVLRSRDCRRTGRLAATPVHPANTGYTARAPISMGRHRHQSLAQLECVVQCRVLPEAELGRSEAEHREAERRRVERCGRRQHRLGLGRGTPRPSPGVSRAIRRRLRRRPPTWGNALRAVSAYQRTLNSKKRAVSDKFLAGNKKAISESAKRGSSCSEAKPTATSATMGLCSPTTATTTSACQRARTF